MRFKNKTHTIKVGSFGVLCSPSSSPSYQLRERTRTDDTSQWKNGDLILITSIDTDSVSGRMFGTNITVGALLNNVRPATIEEINNFYKRVYSGRIFTNVVETFKEHK